MDNLGTTERILFEPARSCSTGGSVHCRRVWSFPFSKGFLSGASARKHPEQTIIAFVACLFEHEVRLLRALRHFNDRGPRSRPRSRVVQSHLVCERLRISARKALD